MGRTEESEPEHRMDEADRQRGLKHIREIRASLATSAPSQPTESDADEAPPPVPVEPEATSAEASRVDEEAAEQPRVSAFDDPEVMVAEMAAAAERAHMERRLRQLEIENAQMRNLLSEILRLISTGLATDPATLKQRLTDRLNNDG